MKEQWRKQMQQKLSDFRRPAPDVDWSAVEKAVTKERQAQQQRRNATTVMLRRLAVAAAAALLLGFWFWQQDDKLQTQYEAQLTLSDAQPLTSLQGEGSVSPSPQRAGADSLSHANHYSPQPLHLKGGERQHRPDATPSTAANDQPDNEPAATSQNQQPTESLTQNDTPAENAPRNATPSNTATVLPPSPAFHHITAAKPSRLTAKVYFSNGMEGSRSSDYSLSQLSLADYSSANWGSNGNGNGDNNSGGNSGKDGSDISTGEHTWDHNGGGDDGDDDNNSDGGSARRFTRTSHADDGQSVATLRTDEQTHHRYPLRFGLSLRYRLGDRWSLESGVIMALHSSELSTVTTIPEQSSQPREWWYADQSLTYLGIPLHANYQLWSNRRLSVYATAGGAVEKMIRGRQNVETRRDGQLQERYERSVSIRPLQLSLDGGVGIEYMFANRFSLFAEPTVGYYFDNGSTVSTIYQDHPLNFNLNVGLRLSLR